MQEARSLLDVVVAVESAYEKRYISQHAEKMQQFLDLRDKWRENAQRITGRKNGRGCPSEEGHPRPSYFYVS